MAGGEDRDAEGLSVIGGEGVVAPDVVTDSRGAGDIAQDAVGPGGCFEQVSRAAQPVAPRPNPRHIRPMCSTLEYASILL